MLSKRQRRMVIDSSDSESESQERASPLRRNPQHSSPARNGSAKRVKHPPVKTPLKGQKTLEGYFNRLPQRNQSTVERHSECREYDSQPVPLATSGNRKRPRLEDDLPWSDPRSSIWEGRENSNLAVVIETRANEDSDLLHTLHNESWNKGFSRIHEGDRHSNSIYPHTARTYTTKSSLINHTQQKRFKGSHDLTNARVTKKIQVDSDEPTERGLTESEASASEELTLPTSMEDTPEPPIRHSGRPGRSAACAANQRLNMLAAQDDTENDKLPRQPYDSESEDDFHDNTSDDNVLDELSDEDILDEEPAIQGPIPGSHYHDNSSILQETGSKPVKTKTARPKAAKTKLVLDTSLPPLANINDIFADMIEKALELGFKKVLDHLKSRTLRVATMCSGTESPLLALKLFEKALRERGLHFNWEHMFSAEIVPFKQAYIERNFNPKIIFRDIRELSRDGATHGTTAYGGRAEIPGDIDMLIAGFSCVDFSGLNNKKKKLSEGGESGDTFQAILNYAAKFRPKVIILENIVSAPWTKEVIPSLEKIGYSAKHKILDTKNYYIPQTRNRGYLIAFDSRNNPLISKEIKLFVELMQKLQRPSSSSVEAFLLPDDDQRLVKAREKGFKDDSARTRDVDWTRCQARHQVVRNELELGYHRPLMKWVEGGVCDPPDYMWRKWATNQVERVWDSIDILYLRDLTTGLDHQHKLVFLDLSQNVDRAPNSKCSGVIGCLTPTGIMFSTLRGGPIIGLEALALQGLPIEMLNLTHETQAQLQDLAGNAMTSTVVGAAILSALILAIRVFTLGTDESPLDPQTEADQPPTSLQGEEILESEQLNLDQYNPLSVRNAMRLAEQGGRRCYCEGRFAVSRYPIQECKLCSHTVCTKCGGKSQHILSPQDAGKRLQPAEIEKELKSSLPMKVDFHIRDSLTFEGAFEEARELNQLPYSESDIEAWDLVRHCVYEAFKSELRFQSIIRSEVLTVCYDSDEARLELVMDVSSVEWRLFAKVADTEPGDSRMRQILKQPIARMKPKKESSDITQGSWALWIPHEKTFDIALEKQGELQPSFENSLGLKMFTDTFVWNEFSLTLDCEGKSEKEYFDMNISGTYTSLPNCGSARGSLHVRDGAQDGQHTYFYLDPDRVGETRFDSFIFAQNHRRLNYGDHRGSLTRVEREWRPPMYALMKSSADDSALYQPVGTDKVMTESEIRKPQAFHLLSEGQWMNVKYISIRPSKKTPGFEEYRHIPPNFLAHSGVSCEVGQILIEHVIQEQPAIVSTLPRGSWLEIEKPSQKAFFRSCAWLMDKGRIPDGLNVWRSIPEPNMELCETCAPIPPRIMWRLQDTGKLAPHEDLQQATVFERSMKRRPKAFSLEVCCEQSSSTNSTKIRIGLNYSALMHRAAATLAHDVGLDGIKVAWRLVTDSAPSAKPSFSDFRLKDNKKDRAANTPSGFRIPLRPEQKRSLHWMIKQEEEAAPFIEEEIEEDAIPEIGWRAEGRASKEILVRGGVLSDDVGYGKTAVTLALIDAQYEQDRPAALEEVLDRIPVKATLILVPPHLPDQWKREVEKFMDPKRRKYNVIVLKSILNLKSKTIEEIQKADIIIASYNMCDADAYMFQLAQFAGVVEFPENKNDRVLASWYQNARCKVLENVALLKTGGKDLKEKIAQDLKNDIADASATETFVPSKRLRGQAYQDAKAGKNKKRTPDGTIVKNDKNNLLKKRTDDFNLHAISKGKSWTSMRCPLLEMFKFRRLVVDEYTYVAGHESICVQNISASNRWILSATPPLRDFADIKSVATFLGINLGSVDVTAGVIRGDNIKSISKDWTATESFRSYKSDHSASWHRNRQAKAQAFLDQFARRNIPDIDDISSAMHLRMVSLPPAEYAVYLELQQIVDAIGGKMLQKDRVENDRDQRIQEVFRNSDSAEEALLKCATHFDIEMNDEKTRNALETCKSITIARKDQLDSHERNMARKLKHTEWLCSKASKFVNGFVQKDAEKDSNYTQTRHAIRQYQDWKTQNSNGNNQYGDKDTAHDIAELIKTARLQNKDSDWKYFYKSGKHAKAEESTDHDEEIDERKEIVERTEESEDDDDFVQEPPKKRAKLSTRRKKTGEKTTKKKNSGNKEVILPSLPDKHRVHTELRDQTNEVRKMARELVNRRRAYRLFNNILERLLFSADAAGQNTSCNMCDHCDKESIRNRDTQVVESVEEHPKPLSILPTCGHKLCDVHIEMQHTQQAQCLVDGCNALFNVNQILKPTDLAVQDAAQTAKTHFGTKVRDIIELIRKLPDDEQVLLFVQFPTVINILKLALSNAGIVSIDLKEHRDPSKILLDFQTSTGTAKAKILILSIEDSSAAGSNLTNANHVIFVSPYLTKHQQTYDAAMKQAVGRARRFGQTKVVHVYHFLTLKTYDVEYLESKTKSTLEKGPQPDFKPFESFQHHGYHLKHQDSTMETLHSASPDSSDTEE